MMSKDIFLNYLKIVGYHGNRLPIKQILYQPVFGDKCYIIGHKFTVSVTMDVSPLAWFLARALLNTTVKPLKNKQNKILMTNGSLMKVESIAECFLGAFCNTFDLH